VNAYERFIAAIEAHGSSRQGGNWTCPAHDDRTASLSVTEARDRVLVHCHANCPTSDILGVLGMTEADLYNETLEKAIAAAAIIGLRIPPIASGIAATL